MTATSSTPTAFWTQHVRTATGEIRWGRTMMMDRTTVALWTVFFWPAVNLALTPLVAIAGFYLLAALALGTALGGLVKGLNDYRHTRRWWLAQWAGHNPLAS